MKVKICGITNLADARYAAAAGADYLGFILHRGSPRFVETLAAAEIIEWIAGPLTVGVFVNEDPETVNAASDAAGFDLVQLHGDEDPNSCRLIERPVVKAIRVRPGETARDVSRRMEPYAGLVEFFLLDAWDQRLAGGTGKSVDRRLAAELAQSFPVFLAGGLRPDNVVEAIRDVDPAGVDVSSGLEKAPGEKDFGRIDAFFEALLRHHLIGDRA
jgi:phosphoribosylanthranilate isomerase